MWSETFFSEFLERFAVKKGKEPTPFEVGPFDIYRVVTGTDPKTDPFGKTRVVIGTNPLHTPSVVIQSPFFYRLLFFPFHIPCNSKHNLKNDITCWQSAIYKITYCTIWISGKILNVFYESHMVIGAFL